jgi:hypothetical protein
LEHASAQVDDWERDEVRTCAARRSAASSTAALLRLLTAENSQ